jgi:hypothetical protein
MHGLAVLLFAVATGITCSGLVANIYRILGSQPKTTAGVILETAVMVFAGPVILIGNATRSFKKKSCSRAGYVFAIALCGYWSFATGIFILSVCLSLRA